MKFNADKVSSNVNPPERGFDYVLPFGRYKGKTIQEVIDEDAGYMYWAQMHVSWLRITNEVYEAILNHGGLESHYSGYFDEWENDGFMIGPDSFQ